MRTTPYFLMEKGLVMEQGRKDEFVDVAVCSHFQHPCILFMGQREGSVVEMEETQVMAVANLFSLLCKTVSTLLFSRKTFAMRV